MIVAPLFDRKLFLWLWRWAETSDTVWPFRILYGLTDTLGVQGGTWTSPEDLWAMGSSVELVGVLFPPKPF